MDKEKLINVISQFMRNKMLDNLLPSPLPCSNEKSYWGEITILMFGSFDRVKSLNIYNLWIRGGPFKQKIMDELIKLNSECEDSLENRSNSEKFCFILYLSNNFFCFLLY